MDITSTTTKHGEHDAALRLSDGDESISKNVSYPVVRRTLYPGLR